MQSYRDAWRLFLRFTAKRRKRPVADLELEDFTEADVLSFLNHIDHERHSTTMPLAAKQCAEVLHVPFKLAWLDSL